MTPALQADRDQVLAFRLAGHHLDRRLPEGSLLAAAAGGVQDTPPGSAALALHARVAGLSPPDLGRALAEDKALLQLWSLRLSPHLVPADDVPVFTTGAIPVDEASLRAAMPGAMAALDRAGVTATEAVERTGAAAREALDGRALTKGELSGEVSRRLPREMVPWCEPCQVHHVSESVFRALGPLGVASFAPRAGRQVILVRMDQWLGAARPPADRPRARAELLRRYLHRYGPSTPGHFAEWAGIGSEDASSSWRLLDGELAEVAVEGRERAWVLETDIPALQSPPPGTGARLLPPSDPYLGQRDRDLPVPDQAARKRIWQAIGSPGVLLLDGRVAGTWRSRKQGRRLQLTIEPFGLVRRSTRDALETEAASIALWRGTTTVDVTVAE